MTIHAAKGLEFPVVCVADLGRAGRGDDGGLQVTDGGRVGLRIASFAGRGRAALDLEEIAREQLREAEEEERRILYVAMTRAQRRLVLSGATDLGRWPEPRPLGEPMSWVWRAVAPGLPRAAAAGPRGELDSGAGPVAYSVLSPDTVDVLLPPAARSPRPRPPAGEAAGREALDPSSRQLRLPGLDPDPRAYPAVPAPPAVSPLSYSAIERYARCPYRFYLEGVLGLPTAPEGADRGADCRVPARVRGTVVHEILERVSFDRPRAPTGREVAARLESHAVEARTADVEALRELVIGWIRSELFARAAGARAVRTEVPFGYVLDLGFGREVLVEGVLDLHAREDRGVLVVDHKTDRLGDRDPAEAAGAYATQRLVYALAGLRDGAQRVEVAHCFLERPDAPVLASFTQDDRSDVESALADLAAGVADGRFPPAQVPHRDLCLGCPGRAALCSWPPERTGAAGRSVSAGKELGRKGTPVAQAGLAQLRA
jgi:RecB family exonuclease